MGFGLLWYIDVFQLTATLKAKTLSLFLSAFAGGVQSPRHYCCYYHCSCCCSCCCCPSPSDTRKPAKNRGASPHTFRADVRIPAQKDGRAARRQQEAPRQFDKVQGNASLTHQPPNNRRGYVLSGSASSLHDSGSKKDNEWRAGFAQGRAASPTIKLYTGLQ